MLDEFLLREQMLLSLPKIAEITIRHKALKDKEIYGVEIFYSKNEPAKAFLSTCDKSGTENTDLLIARVLSFLASSMKDYPDEWNLEPGEMSPWFDGEMTE